MLKINNIFQQNMTYDNQCSENPVFKNTSKDFLLNNKQDLIQNLDILNYPMQST